MTVPPDTIEHSYGFCRQICRRAGSNFPLAFLMLPQEQRRAMEALYAFMRHTDDLTDDSPSDDLSRVAIAAWREQLQQALQGRLAVDDAPSLLAPPASFLLFSLADAVQCFRIPPEHLFAAIDGVEMDLDGNRYETFEQLERYCERVASAVGLACIHIWGFDGQEALEPARRVGLALQLTNILRDVKEDAARGRVYLPLEDLRTCGYAVEDLRANITNDAFFRLMRLEIERAESFYRDGAALLDHLQPAGRRIFGMMTATYHALLRQIARQPADVFQRRIRLTRFKKLQLAARWFLLTPRKESL